MSGTVPFLFFDARGRTDVGRLRGLARIVCIAVCLLAYSSLVNAWTMCVSGTTTTNACNDDTPTRNNGPGCNLAQPESTVIAACSAGTLWEGFGPVKAPALSTNRSVLLMNSDAGGTPLFCRLMGGNSSGANMSYVLNSAGAEACNCGSNDKWCFSRDGYQPPYTSSTCTSSPTTTRTITFQYGLTYEKLDGGSVSMVSSIAYPRDRVNIGSCDWQLEGSSWESSCSTIWGESYSVDEYVWNGETVPAHTARQGVVYCTATYYRDGSTASAPPAMSDESHDSDHFIPEMDRTAIYDAGGISGYVGDLELFLEAGGGGGGGGSVPGAEGTSPSIPGQTGGVGDIDTETVDMEGGSTSTGAFSFSLPGFCSWAPSVCNAVQWLTGGASEDDQWVAGDRPDVPSVDISDYEEIDLGGGSYSCPSPTALGTWGGRSLMFDWSLSCDFVVAARPIVLLASGLAAMMILVGLRAGGPG